MSTEQLSDPCRGGQMDMPLAWHGCVAALADDMKASPKLEQVSGCSAVSLDWMRSHLAERKEVDADQNSHCQQAGHNPRTGHHVPCSCAGLDVGSPGEALARSVVCEPLCVGALSNVFTPGKPVQETATLPLFGANLYTLPWIALLATQSWHFELAKSPQCTQWLVCHTSLRREVPHSCMHDSCLSISVA